MARVPIVLWTTPQHEEVATALRKELKRGGVTVVSPFAQRAAKVPRLLLLFDAGIGSRSNLGRALVNWTQKKQGPVQGKSELLLCPVRTEPRQGTEGREFLREMESVAEKSHLRVRVVSITAGSEEPAGRDIVGLLGASIPEQPEKALREATPPLEADTGVVIGTEALDLGLAGPGAGGGARTPGPLRPRGRPRKVEVIPVLFATDRARSPGAKELADRFTAARAVPEGMAYGICEVSVPAARHKTGEIERPSIFSVFSYEDPVSHFVLHSIEEMDLPTFQTRIATGLAGSGPAILVFIHGYKVTFQDSLFRTAQLAYDLRFAGVPVCYSWPSEGNVLKYTYDENNIEWTEPHLLQFLTWLLATFPGAAVHLIAHSMGNRALTRVLEQAVIQKALTQGRGFQQVILAAPDVDGGVFTQRAQVFQQAAARVTLYASEHDRALWLSEGVHGYPRAGDAGEDLVVVPGIDTVDASDVSGPVLSLRHSYAAEQPRLLRDIDRLLRKNQPPPRGKNLVRNLKGTLPFWTFARGRL